MNAEAGSGQPTESQGEAVSAAIPVNELQQQQTPAPEAGKEMSKEAPAEAPAVDPVAEVFAKEPDKAEGDPGKDDKSGEGKPEGDRAGDQEPIALTYPEGFVPDKERMGEFLAIAKETGIKQEQAQKLFDLYAKERTELYDHVVSEEQKYRANLDRQWQQECRDDPEFGGTKYEENRNYAMAAIRRYVSPDDLTRTSEKDGKMGFLELVTKANLANHPAFFRFLANVGRKTAEAGPALSDASDPERQLSTTEGLYKGMNLK